MHQQLTLFDVLFHAIMESIYLLPYLFITYLILEYLEKQTQKLSLFFSKTRSILAPILAGISGILPQCGLGVAGANFYATRLITTGTLVSLFLATSDEMLPILLSNGVPIQTIVKIILYKTVIAIGAGLFLDCLLFKKNKGKFAPFKIEPLCHEAGCGCHQKSLWLSALNHTTQIFVFILCINIILNTLFMFIHPSELKESILAHTVLGPLTASLLGLIPNCAISVISAQLFAEKTLSDGAFLSAILANAGVGLLVLLKVNSPLKQSLKIILFIFMTALLSGMLFGIFGLSF